MDNAIPNIRFVICPKCVKLIPEFANVPVYRCGGCGTVLRAKYHIASAENANSASPENSSQNLSIDMPSTGLVYSREQTVNSSTEVDNGAMQAAPSNYPSESISPPAEHGKHSTEGRASDHGNRMRTDQQSMNLSTNSNEELDGSLKLSPHWGLLGLGMLFFLASMLALRPSHPVVTLSGATVTNFHLSRSSNQLSADIFLDLSVRNPNKNISLQHKSVTAAVKYLSGAPLSEVRLPSFHQPAGNNTTELKAELVPRAAYVDSSVLKWIANELEGSGTTTFNVELSTRMTYKPWSLWGLLGKTRILCEDVTVWLPFPDEAHNAGSMIGPQKNCHVTGSWW